MNKKIWNVFLYVLIALLLAGNFFQFVAARTGESKLDQLQALIDERFVGDADPVLLGDAAAAAMIAATGDRWSFYTPASHAQSFKEQMDNAYVGIGITIQDTEDHSGYLVLKVTKGGPAEAAGVLPGDILVQIGDTRVSELPMDEGTALVRGPKGTSVDLVFLRDGQELSFTVERREIETVVAEGRMVAPDIGLVTIYNFDNRSSKETVAAIEELLEQGAEKLILDVRYNPGGFVHELVKTLDYLLPKGDLMKTVDYKGKETQETSGPDCLDIPMAVLVNAESYSAAEFFAAAMQEYEAAVIVGEHTSGKGYFQMTYYLNDGSSVNLSSGKYFTPNGVCLQDIGIQPDIEVIAQEELQRKLLSQTATDEEDLQLQAAIEALEQEGAMHLQAS